MIARPCAVPGDSLLAPRAAQPGTYADCFEVMHPGAVDLAAFLTAFYSTPLFRLERLILALVLRRPVRQAEVAALAAGAKHFAVWTVEGRDAVQILLADRAGRTLSWLAAAPKQGGATRLLFGSAVLPGQGGRLSAPVRALLPLHRLYARLLLRSAEWRLRWH